MLQPAVLAPVPPVARYLTFTLQPGANPRRVLAAFAEALFTFTRPVPNPRS